jgi:hypothetical protein
MHKTKISKNQISVISYLHPYSEFNAIWSLANHVANNIPVSTNHASTLDNVPFASNDGDVESDVKESSTSTSGILDDTILHVTRIAEVKGKLNKTDVMPTWAATKALLHYKACIGHTHCEVVAPLFKMAPTDYATLFSVLSITQEISAIVIGPKCHMIITLDLALYEQALKIKKSEENNCVLRLVHVVKVIGLDILQH